MARAFERKTITFHFLQPWMFYMKERVKLLGDLKRKKSEAAKAGGVVVSLELEGNSIWKVQIVLVQSGESAWETG